MMVLERLKTFAIRMAAEPPIRLFSRYCVKSFAKSIRTKAKWDAVARPHYLVGLLAAADQARRENVAAVCAIEFGVAAGEGLVAMQEYAAAVDHETGVRILVYGFDSGQGLPHVSNDYRDHPDQWRGGDYRMDEAALRRRLEPRTALIIGDVKETVNQFVNHVQQVPLGFLAMDLDLYSSTHAALQVLSLPGKRMLKRVPLYFDDVRFIFNHKFAGEFLAINEFNEANEHVKIDIWHGLADGRAFFENHWLRNMFVAHDLEAISGTTLKRAPAVTAV